MRILKPTIQILAIVFQIQAAVKMQKTKLVLFSLTGGEDKYLSKNSSLFVTHGGMLLLLLSLSMSLSFLLLLSSLLSLLWLSL